MTRIDPRKLLALLRALEVDDTLAIILLIDTEREDA
jgi:hypothetical protein